MERDYFVFEVLTEVRFTKADVDTLFDASERHYDGKCKSLSRQGGFIYGMRNVLHGEEEVRKDTPSDEPLTGTWKLTMSDLDLLCKVTEPIVNADIGKVPLHFKFKELFFEAREKYREVNKHLEGL